MTKEQYLAKRKALLAEAESLVNEGKNDEFEAKQQEIKDLDKKFEDHAKNMANLNALKDNHVVQSPAKEPEDGEGVVVDKTVHVDLVAEKKKAREIRGKALKANNAVTVGSSNVIMPRYDADDIRPVFNEVSSLIDRVSTKFLMGGESYRQPYVTGYGEGGYTAEGDDYTTADVTFAFASINKAKVTAYAEDSEEVLKLPAADYDAEVMNGVRIASRKRVTREILIGTGATNRLAGIFSTAATAIDAATDVPLAEIDETTLDEIVYSFGGDEDVEDVAVLILNKKDLKSFVKLRDAEGQKIYKVVSNGNTGTIDGIPFLINSACKAVSDPATEVDDYAMAYGPLSNYQVTVFSDMDVQRSTDFKFKSGMIAHRSSVFLGGNVVSKNGFLRVKKA